MALIEKSEALFAEHGIHNVSLRMIIEAAGSSDRNAVGYYFGSKNELLKEIYAHRAATIEQRRQQLLARVEEAGLGNEIMALLFVGYWPVFELKNRSGRHSHAGFLLSLQREGIEWVRANVEEMLTATGNVLEGRMLAALKVSREDLRWRTQIIQLMVLDGIQQIDQKVKKGLGKREANSLFFEILTMAAAMMESRQDDGLIEKLGEFID